MTNPYGKTRKVDDPYATYQYRGWEWAILKLNVRPDKVKGNPCASGFMAVSSPCTNGCQDFGDTYLRDVPPLAELVQGVDVLRECGLR